jgi:phosphoenolpyruvate-protein kinase (PTS system EI component)
VATVGEIRDARRAVDEVAAALDEDGIARASDFEIGIMIEVPSAAVMADVLAPHVDFFSIGTNDLTQYTMAADRTNPGVASLADPAHPAVLRLVDQVIRAAHARGGWVGMCGELAGDAAAVPALLGLGLDEFSMAVPSVALVKEAVRSWSIEDARAVARRCLAAADAGEVREILSEPR